LTSSFSLLRVLDRWMIDDTFACRVGRGREAAVKQAMHFCRTQSWCLKLDVRKYFDSIDHDRLLELLTRRFKEVPLHTLFDRIVRSYRGSQGIGLPIGSLMSQHFANFYLGWLDRYVKEALQIRGYVRYMDDMLLWGDDRLELQRIQRECESFVSDQLKLEFKLAQIRRVEHGVSFLGCRLFPTHSFRVALNSNGQIAGWLVADALDSGWNSSFSRLARFRLDQQNLNLRPHGVSRSVG
jgi:RNA-directed DNA polymerase